MGLHKIQKLLPSTGNNCESMTLQNGRYFLPATHPPRVQYTNYIKNSKMKHQRTNNPINKGENKLHE
jgi:hypothetical protein